MNAIGTKDQYLLRVKRGTPLDKVLDATTKGDGCTNEQLAEIGGTKQWSYQLQWLCSFMDNVAVKRSNDGIKRANYYRPGEQAAPVPVSVAEISAPSIVYPVAQEDAPAVSNIRWPEAPPLIDSIGDMYKKPAWFNTMREMVRRGRHIAISGPPGVGKDTAVQELSAEEGRVLVTVGGDGGFRRRDLVGTAQISNGRSFFDVAEYAAAAVYGWWVLLTEVNAADADALIFINSQLAPPYIVNFAGRSYPVHDDFRLFVTYNAGLVGTKPLPQSFKDRFYPIQVGFFNQAQLQSILVAHGAKDNYETECIARYGVELANAHERGQIRYQITSRRLMDATELLNAELTWSAKDALTMAVIAAIDSPIEAKVAKQVLDAMMF